jgi:hypothetical protein
MGSFRDPCFSVSRLSQIDCCKRSCLAPLSMCLGGWIPGAAQIQPGDGWLRFSSTLCTNLHVRAVVFCSRPRPFKKKGRMAEWHKPNIEVGRYNVNLSPPDDSLLDLKPYRFWG